MYLKTVKLRKDSNPVSKSQCHVWNLVWCRENVPVTSPLRTSPDVSDLPLTTETSQEETGNVSSFVQSRRTKFIIFFFENLKPPTFWTLCQVWEVQNGTRGMQASREHWEMWGVSMLFPNTLFLTILLHQDKNWEKVTFKSRGRFCKRWQLGQSQPPILVNKVVPECGHHLAA